MHFNCNFHQVSLIPSNTSGTFIVRVDNLVIWDRRDESTKGFPEAKVLKQLVRDVIDPQKDLGHSDSESRQPSKIISLDET